MEDNGNKDYIFQDSNVTSSVANEEKQATNKCPKCNTENEVSAKFCKSCGASLSVGGSVYCSRCGTKNEEGTKFCKNCGQDLSSNSTKGNGSGASFSAVKILKFLPTILMSFMFFFTLLFAFLPFAKVTESVLGLSETYKVGGFSMIIEMFKGRNPLLNLSEVTKGTKDIATFAGVLYLLIAIMLVVMLINIIFTIGKYNKKTYKGQIIISSILTILSLVLMIIYCVWSSKQTSSLGGELGDLMDELDTGLKYSSMTIPMFIINILMLIGLCVGRFFYKESLVSEKAFIPTPSKKAIKIITGIVFAVLIAIAIVVILINVLQNPAKKLWKKYVNAYNSNDYIAMAETLYPKNSKEYENYIKTNAPDEEGDIDLGELEDELGEDLGELEDAMSETVNMIDFKILINKDYYKKAHAVVEVVGGLEGKRRAGFDLHFVKKEDGKLHLTTEPDFESGNVLDRQVYIAGNELVEVLYKDITSYTIPEDVTSICDGAFSGCEKLVSITLPKTLRAIESSAFEGCKNLKTIIIPDSITSIGENAFKGCDNLTIYCEVGSQPSGWNGNWNPDNCEVIWGFEQGEDYVVMAGLEYKLVDGEVVVYRNGSVSGDVNILSQVTINGTEYSVTSIGDDAFQYCSNLTSIIIPDSVTSIGAGAFEECSGLTSIEIPNSVTSIGATAFFGCDSLTNVIIPSSVTSIGQIAFENCADLTIYCEAESRPNGWYGDFVNNENWFVFTPIYWGVTANDIVTIDGVQYVRQGETAVVSGHNLNITSAVIKDKVTINGTEYNVTSMGGAFSDCSSLTSITIPDSVTSIGSSFYNCSSLTSVTIPDSVTSIGDCAFYDCSSLTSINIPASVTSIGYHAFRSCSSLTSVTIPDSVTSIEDYAFSGCSGLTSIEIPASVTSIGSNTFEGCSSLTSVTIPDSVTSIYDYAFSGCSSLTSVEIPNSVTIISSKAFSGCDNLQYNEYDNALYLGNTENPYLVLVKAKDTSITSCVINANTKIILGSAFAGCSSLTSIIIPEGVTSIGSFAFYKCSSLTIYCEAESKPSGWNSKWYYDGRLVYWGVTANDIVTIDGVTYVRQGESATLVTVPTTLTSYTILSKVTINGTEYSVTSIGSSALEGCSSLESVTIPASVTSIGSQAFSGCSSLESVTIPASVTSIGSQAFSGCTNITNVTMPTIAIGYVPQNKLQTVVINGGKSIGYRAFDGCRNLTSVTIPNSVTSIGSEAFDGCANITNATMPTIAIGYVPKGKLQTVVINGGESIGNSAFDGCSSLESITIPASVTSIGYEAFEDCSSLTSIEIPDSVTSIGYSAFYGCSGLTSVTIPNSVTSIGYKAFYGCDNLQYNEYDNALYLGNTENPYLVLMKAKDTNITSCEINANTKFIYDFAFYDCSGLTSIIIPEGVTSIGSYAFRGCSSLTIYCEAESIPSGWNIWYWNYDDRPVVWGYKGN